MLPTSVYRRSCQVAESQPGNAEAAEDNDHVTSVSEVDQRRSSGGDVRAAGSALHCRTGQSSLPPFIRSTTTPHRSCKISLPLITDRVSGEDVAIGRVLESVNSKIQ